MKKSGYRPYMTKSTVDGHLYYRVRMGRYVSYDSAILAKKAFEKKVKIIAYVTRL